MQERIAVRRDDLIIALDADVVLDEILDTEDSSEEDVGMGDVVDVAKRMKHFMPGVKYILSWELELVGFFFGERFQNDTRRAVVGRIGIENGCSSVLKGERGRSPLTNKMISRERNVHPEASAII